MLSVSKRCEFSGHKGAVFALARAGNHLFSAGDDGIVARWDLTQPDLQGEAVLRVERSVYALLPLPDGRLLAGLSDGTLHLWQPGNTASLHSKRWLTTAIYTLGLHPQTGEVWALCGEGQLLRIYPGTSGPELRQQQVLAGGNLRGLAALPDGRMVIGTAAGDLLLTDAAATVLHRWPAHTQTAFSLAWDAARNRLLSGGRDAMLCAWAATDDWRQTVSLPAHLYTLNAIALSPNGRLIATASRDKTLKLWQADNINLLKVIDFQRNYAHTHSVNQVVWVDDDSFISAGDDRRIIWWQVEGSEMLSPKNNLTS